MDYKEVLKKAESDEPVYLSGEAKRKILSLRAELPEDTHYRFMNLLDQMGELLECVYVGAPLDEEKGKEILLTVKDYKDLLSSLLDDDPEREKKG